MKRKAPSIAKEPVPDALKALRRAAKKAVELARMTGTPAYVLENGRIALEGDSRRLSSHPGVIASYLGATES